MATDLSNLHRQTALGRAPEALRFQPLISEETGRTTHPRTSVRHHGNQATTTIAVNDNLTWSQHSHTIKFGAFYQRARKDQISYGNFTASSASAKDRTARWVASTPAPSGVDLPSPAL
jgi:hypothetical protein